MLRREEHTWGSVWFESIGDGASSPDFNYWGLSIFRFGDDSPCNYVWSRFNDEMDIPLNWQVT